MISVVIPYYNKSLFINRALESCVNQSIKPDEIIIIDDFSKLEEKKNLNEIVFKYKDIIKIDIYSLNINKGPSHCRNVGVKNSSGKIIFFLDADDKWHINKISSHLKIYKDQKISVVYDNQYLYQNEKTFMIDFRIINENFCQELFNGWGPPNLSSLSIRKDIFLKIGGLDENLRFSEDQDLFIKLDQNKIKVHGSQERLTFFSDDDDNRVSYNSIPRINGTILFLEKWKYFFESQFGNKRYIKYRNEYLAKFIYVLVITEMKNLKLILASYIFLRYLFLNIEFYKKIINKIKRKLC
ncbi:glycosyltransferase family 2 protein [Alphaproteobacteria bacterium]|nr:glycosyltransferase family 2 protein [Alphaproteobacteria bacterium]